MELFPQITLDELEQMTVETVIKAKERFKPVATFALFSGGNDSTAMLHLVKGHVDAAVHIVTGIGIPETLDFARLVCGNWGLRLIEQHTDPSVYASMVINGGFPGPALHNIFYRNLKERRLTDLQRSICSGRILFVTGIRRGESKKRVKVPAIDSSHSHATRRCDWANPILHFTSSHLADYRLKHGVPQSKVAALIHKSGDCLCGAHAKQGELEEIDFWFPETGSYIRSLEREAEKKNQPYCRWGWGTSGERANAPAPGPLCQGCSLFVDQEAADA